MSVEVIAEVASNHGGAMSLSLEFIDAFAPYVDTIKWQLTRVAHLRLSDPQYEWFKKAELTLDQFAQLREACHKKGVNFLLTVYNPFDVWEVVELGCNRVKIGSGEAMEPALADTVLQARLSPIVSCGLCRASDTPYARRLETMPTPRYLGCVTRYPAPSGVAAAAMLSEQPFYGWSDHAVGTSELEVAACMGAKILETHVFLRDQARPIRPFEKSVQEMAHLQAFLAENPNRFLGRWQQ